nr:PAS domain S-box protein [Desulfobaculum xiamenense]
MYQQRLATQRRGAMKKDWEPSRAELEREVEELRERVRQLEAERQPVEGDLLHHVVDNLDIPVFVKDEEHRWVYLNRAAGAVFGRTPEEMLGRTDTDFYPPDEAADIWRQDDTVLAQGCPHFFEGRRTWLGGQRQALCLKSPHVDAASGLRYIVGTVQDVSELRATQHAARMSEEKYGLLVENAREAVTVVGEDCVLFANASTAALTGYSLDELHAMPLGDLLHPDDRDAVLSNRALRVQGGDAPETYTFRIVSRDGAVRWVSGSNVRIVWDGLPAVMTFYSDVTDTVVAREALAASERRLRRIMDLVPHMIFARDARGRYIMANRAMAESCGTTVEEMIGTPHERYCTCEGGKCRFLAQDRKVILTGEPRTEPALPFRDATGVDRIVQCSFIPMEGENGHRACLGVGIDVTWERRTRDRLRRLNRGLLSLGRDHAANIAALVALCGELLAADCAVYNRLEGGMLCSRESWNAPPDMPRVDTAPGHICTDVIERGELDRLLVIRDLGKTPYAKSDPNVLAYGLQTYLGMAVMSGGEAVGSLCAVYAADYDPDYEDEWLMGLLTTAIAAEEDRMRATRELFESEGRYRAAFEQVAVGMVHSAPDGRFLKVNDRYCAITGYTRAELLGMKVFDVLHPDERASGAAAYAQLVEGTSPLYDFERRYLRRDGRHVWVRVTASAVRDGKGEVRLVSAMVVDVTSRRSAQEELERTNQQLRAFLDNSSAAIFFKDVESRIIHVNRSWREFMGVSPDRDLRGVSVYDILPKETEATFRAQDREVIAAGQPIQREVVMPLLSGERAILITKFPMCDEAGVLWAIGGILADITERRLAEQALRDSEEKYRRLFHNASDAIFLHAAAPDGQGWRMLECNDRACAMLGLERHELLSMNPQWLVGQAGCSTRVRTFESTVRSGGGDELQVEIAAHAFLLAGRPVTLSVVRDITQRKRMENALMRRDSVLEAVAFAARRFLGSTDWHEHIDDVLELLGESADVSRAYVFRLVTDESGDTGMRLEHEWCAPGIASQLDAPDLQFLSFSRADLHDLRDTLATRHAFFGHTQCLPEADRLVLEPQDIRSVAIVPVFAGGQWWGALGVDECRHDRDWYSVELESLVVAADMLGNAVLRGNVERAMRESDHRFRLIAGTVEDVFWISEPGRHVLDYFSPTLARWLGDCETTDAARTRFLNAVNADDLERVRAVYDETDREQWEVEYRLKCIDGEERWFRDRAFLVHGETGERRLIAGITADITELKLVDASLRESLRVKELLLQEIHHRVKNNLQIISSLLDMAGRRICDAKASEIIRDLQSKIHSMGMIHMQLYGLGNYGSIDISDYAQMLTWQLGQMYNAAWVTPVFDMETIHLPLDLAIPCGLVLSEALSNAFKHAYREKRDGSLAMSIGRTDDGRVRICVVDDGPGIPGGVNFATASSLGLRLMRNIVEFQLGGTLDMKTDNGTAVTITFGVAPQGGANE